MGTPVHRSFPFPPHTPPVMPSSKIVPVKGSKTKNGAALVAYTELKASVLSMKRDGMSNKAIAANLNVSTATISRLIPRIFREMLMEAGAAEVRVLELMRMDQLTQRMWKKFNDQDWVPDDKFIHAYLAVSKRKADLTGADAPKRVNVDLAMAQLPDEASSASELLADDVTRFMSLADKLKTAGIGSGRADMEPKELSPANNPDGTPYTPGDDDVVDGEIVPDSEIPIPPTVSDEGVEYYDDTKYGTQAPDEFEDDGDDYAYGDLTRNQE